MAASKMVESSSDGTISSGNSSMDSTSNGITGERHRLSIIVFSGDPIDAPQYRHTGLLIQHLSQEGTVKGQRFLEVVGAAGFFSPEETPDCDPMNDSLFVGMVVVATMPASGSSDSRLRAAIWSTTINNEEIDWNCQNWVGDALYSCTKAGLISKDETERAIDGMTDFILEAPDEA
jgi:hypothetical protein